MRREEHGTSPQRRSAVGRSRVRRFKESGIAGCVSFDTRSTVSDAWQSRIAYGLVVFTIRPDDRGNWERQ